LRHHFGKRCIKYQATFEKEERAEMERKKKQIQDIVREDEKLIEEAKMKQKKNLSKSNKQNVSDNSNLNDVLVDHEPMLIKNDSIVIIA
jgi:hypothetical protein